MLAEALEEATRALHLQLETAVAMEQVFGEEYMVVPRCKQQFTACLFGSDVPRGFDAVLKAVYSSSFRDFCKFVAGGGKLSAGLCDDELGCSDLDMELGDGENDDAVELEDDDGEMEEEGGGWDELGFKSICANVVMVGAQPLAEEVFTEILYSRISDRIQAMSSGQFETPQLGRVVGWSERCILPWLRLLLREAETEPGGGDAEYTQWKTRLQFFMFETFGSLRIKEMFDIIVEYPDSMPALKDLKASLTKTHQYSQLASSVSDACCKRLLHAGANTGDIISTYISTIKALHELDPTGMTIATVSRSIQQYLRDRQDTVRCIVMGLTDDTSSELFEELRKSGAEEGRWRPKQADWDEGADDEEDDDCLARVANPGSAASQWMPEPIAAGPSTAYHKGSIDIIGMLVDIYGSTDLFLNEYRVLLSDKLLALTTYEIDKELHNVELLKLRFGEASLHGCEVMLKDLGDSKRLDAYVHNESAKHSDEAQVQGWLDSKILSAAFWPPLPQDAMTMHDSVAHHFNAYAKFYSLLKKPRSLKWKPTCGVVKLTITFDDGRQVPFTVSPVHANIILHFQEQPTWTLDELSSKIGIASDQVKRRMIFWVGSGVCTETVSSGGSISYTVVEKPSANALKAHSRFVSLSSIHTTHADLHPARQTKSSLPHCPMMSDDDE